MPTLAFPWEKTKFLKNKTLSSPWDKAHLYPLLFGSPVTTLQGAVTILVPYSFILYKKHIIINVKIMTKIKFKIISSY